MSSIVEHGLSVFMAFFAIMNPIANTTVFASLSENLNYDERRKLAAKGILIAFVTIVAFALIGQYLFQLFGISLPAFRIAGGVLIFIIGYHMLNGKESKFHSADTVEHPDLSVSPLAVPILAGPGTIATAMNYSMGSWHETLITIGAFFILCLVTLCCFLLSTRILKRVGEAITGIITRLMGLILCVVGTQMLVDGIIGAFQLNSLMH
ncbi:hypothetical protein A3758_13170 [Oleiphilus sp. HI0118]|nr:hypothetical protein A3758_21240 [Oleiphilus sp. HI0118]KZZ49804.1 hypothetical protein A3758_13170 [Oleiphilus sp. HI0118]